MAPYRHHSATIGLVSMRGLSQAECKDCLDAAAVPGQQKSGPGSAAATDSTLAGSGGSHTGDFRKRKAGMEGGAPSPAGKSASHSRCLAFLSSCGKILLPNLPLPSMCVPRIQMVSAAKCAECLHGKIAQGTFQFRNCVVQLSSSKLSSILKHALGIKLLSLQQP